LPASANTSAAPPESTTAAEACLLALLSLLVFLPAVWCDFVNWDDDRYVYGNPLVLGGLTAAGMRGAWREVVFSNWAPLTILSYQFDASVFGRSAWGFHLTNVVLHAASTGLLYLALVRLTGWAGRSAAATVLWAVHPLRVESVAWISERKDVLSVLFMMLALLAYDRYCRRPGVYRYLWVALAMLGSLLCKPTLVTLPALLLLLDVWPLGRLRLPWVGAPTRGDGASPYPASSWRLVLGEKIPLLAISLAFGRITLQTQADALASQLGMSFLRARLPNAATGLAWYLWKSLVPTGLHPACHHPGSGVSWAIVAVSAIAVVAVAAGAILVARSRPVIPWGLGWFVVAILPVLGLVQTGFQSHADRFTYIPHVGLAVAVVWTACELAGRFQPPRWALPAALGVVVVAGVVMTQRQIAVWRRSDTLWDHVLAVDPGNAVGLGKKAEAAFGRGRLDEAAALYKRSLVRHEFPWVIASLAGLYHERGDGAQMQRYRDWAARVAPRDETVVAMLRDLPAGVPRAVQRPAVDPLIEPLVERGSIELNAGRFQSALAVFLEAIAAAPSCAVAHNLAGIACVGLDRQPEAAGHFREAIRLDEGYFGFRVNLARVLAVLQDWEGCVVACEAALVIKPDDPELEILQARARRNAAAISGRRE
jgi:Flp pilus assembly protein TadD